MSKSNKLAGKHVLVIGGSKGIGRGVVEASLESGARVTLVGSSQKSADTTVSEVKTLYPSADIVGLGCDLSHETVENDLEELFKRAGPVNHVVYTAADSLAIAGLQDLTVDVIRKASQMRLIVPITVGKVAARHLPKSRDSSLTITSGSIADRPRPNWSLIAYMGAGLNSLARNLALDMAPVRVNAVEPGFVDTPLWNANMTSEEKAAMLKRIGDEFPTGQVGQVEDVAEAYLYSMKDRNCTGETIKTRSGSHLI